jgi:hypothetical protein
MSIWNIVTFLSDVRSGKLKSGLEAALARIISQNSQRKDAIINDALTAAIVIGNLPFAKHCVRLGGDLFLQGKRFDPLSASYEFFRKTPANEKTIAWVEAELDEKDTFACKRFGWSIVQFCKTFPGCTCVACTNPEAVDPCPVDLHSVLGRDAIVTLKTWLTGLQQRPGAIHRNHTSQFAEFFTATSEYLKYLNRRYL